LSGIFARLVSSLTFSVITGAILNYDFDLFFLTQKVILISNHFQADDFYYTARYLLAAAQCIVIGSVFVCLCVYLRVCCHDNSKLRASTLTKLDL